MFEPSIDVIVTGNAYDSLKGRIFEVSLGDLNKDEEQAYRKIKLRVDEVQGKNCLTNFHSSSSNSYFRNFNSLSSC